MQQQQQQLQQQQQQLRKQEKETKKQHSNQTPSQQQPPTMLSNLVPKLEAMDSTNTSSSMTSTAVDKHYQDFIHNDMNFSSTRQNTPTNSPSKDGIVLGMKDPHDTLHFFNETLDLSQEDIQRTLSANMPLGGHTADDAMNGEINPMDFIENCHSGGADDDVFVNLDAFDMLVEFPELELDPKSSFLHVS
jgi:calmodulin-binding transcription activator